MTDHHDQPGSTDSEPDSWLLEASPDLELVAQLLAEGSSDAAAALAIGRSAKWVQRARHSNPEFVERVRELKEQRARQASAGLGALLEQAVQAVARGLVADRTADQLRAAALVFDRFKTFRSDSAAVEIIAGLRQEVEELHQLLEDMPIETESETADERL